MFSNNNIKIKVYRKKLIEKLKENRETHKENYEKAKEGFRKLVIEELEEKIDDAKSGKKVDLRFENHPPENHIEEYDDVIGMLQIAVDEQIELDHSQYKQYINDEWDWKRNWSLSNSAYLSAVSN